MTEQRIMCRPFDGEAPTDIVAFGRVAWRVDPAVDAIGSERLS